LVTEKGRERGSRSPMKAIGDRKGKREGSRSPMKAIGDRKGKREGKLVTNEGDW
jgi:hypothetical protein